MNHITVAVRKSSKTKFLLTVCTVLGAVALPQIVHWIGNVGGMGSMLGEVLLPMHFFVLLAGFLGGPVVGVATGACAPLISYLLSGMPAVAMMPYLLPELVGYGLVAGLMSEVRVNSFVKLLTAQIGGRLLRLFSVLLTGWVMNGSVLAAVSVWDAVKKGLLGIALQWCILPLLLSYLNRHAERHE